MAIIKLTKSKKAVMFVDEDGTPFMTSVVAIQNMLSGNIKGDFVLLSRMPFSINPSRFKKSPLYKPAGYIEPKDSTKNTSDALSVQNRQDNKEKKQYIDKVVKW